MGLSRRRRMSPRHGPDRGGFDRRGTSRPPNKAVERNGDPVAIFDQSGPILPRRRLRRTHGDVGSFAGIQPAHSPLVTGALAPLASARLLRRKLASEHRRISRFARNTDVALGQHPPTSSLMAGQPALRRQRGLIPVRSPSSRWADGPRALPTNLALAASAGGWLPRWWRSASSASGLFEEPGAGHDHCGYCTPPKRARSTATKGRPSS